MFDSENRYYVFALAVILGLGVFLRIAPSGGFSKQGPDELFYEIYTNAVDRNGPGAYPQIFAEYIEHQSKPETPLVLPPGRILFIVSAWLCMQVTGLAAMPAVHAVSALSSMLLLGVTAAFAWRARSPAFSLGISALMGAAPLQIHLAQRALIDGFFALWAMATLWCLWECLRQPGHRGWLLGYGASIVAMILTKENAAFVMMGAGVLLLSNRWLAFGKTTPQLWAVTVAAPLFAAVILWIAAGGLDVLIAAYRINVAKSCVSPYAIKTGDGPWYRYVVDLILLSPAVILLAVAGLGRLRFEDKPGLFFAVFFAITFAIMSQLHGGMNARYTNIWDLEFRYFALSVVVAMAALVPERLRRIALITAVGLLCLSEIWQYQVYFVEGGIYDPVPAMLMKRVDILK